MSRAALPFELFEPSFESIVVQAQMKEGVQAVQEASSQQAVQAAQMQQQQQQLNKFWNAQVKIINEIDPSPKHTTPPPSPSPPPPVFSARAFAFPDCFWELLVSAQHKCFLSPFHSDKFEFKVHQLPLARIKKIMKSDDEVRMISAEAPVMFAKGCCMDGGALRHHYY